MRCLYNPYIWKICVPWNFLDPIQNCVSLRSALFLGHHISRSCCIAQNSKLFSWILRFSNAISKRFQCNCEMNVLDCMSPSNLNSANFICYLILIWFVRTSIYYQFEINILLMESSNQFWKIRISTLHEFNHLRFQLY